MEEKYEVLLRAVVPFLSLDGYTTDELSRMPDQVIIRIEATVGELVAIERAYQSIIGDKNESRI